VAGELHFDAVVVGSGFGGAVMAYRLSEAGLRVCVLERGRAYPPGSFPRTPRGMRDNRWVPNEGRFGLFDYWTFRDFDALVASGLGGGSLIYANVLMRKDERWFVKEDVRSGGYEYWPVTRSELDPHYDRVEAMLRPQRYPFDRAPYSSTPKTSAFFDAANGLGMEPFLPNLAITFANDAEPPVPGEPIREAHSNLHGRTRDTCRLCGECDVGCNYGSKNTLDFNYLSEAQRLGAEIWTGCEVVRLEVRRQGGYEVHYRRHPIDGDRGPSKPEMLTVDSDRLILAAGSLGSTLLLLRNRSVLPRLSKRLGSRFCGNGDLVGYVVSANRLEGGQEPRVFDPSYGPVITSALRVGDALDGEKGRGFYLEDAGFPAHLTWVLQMLDAPATLFQYARQRLLGRRHPDGTKRPGSTLLLSLLTRTQYSAGVLPLLGIGRDVPDGQMGLRDGKLDVRWRKQASDAYYQRVRGLSKRMADELGGRYFYGPRFFLGRGITVHPLGGCPMGRNEQEGVVDADGQAFNYPGLYVADGSVMPGPVGTNPSLTIAALADRFADRLIERRHTSKPAR
jgi:cholesterol oxidase